MAKKISSSPAKKYSLGKGSSKTGVVKKGNVANSPAKTFSSKV